MCTKRVNGTITDVPQKEAHRKPIAIQMPVRICRANEPQHHEVHHLGDGTNSGRDNRRQIRMPIPTAAQSASASPVISNM